MHVVRKAASVFLFVTVAATTLAGCHGGNDTTFSAVPPTGAMTATQGTSATPPYTLPWTFTATGKSADGNPATYSWSFGDQTVSGSTQVTTGTPVTHQYAEPGVYSVTLTVTDDHGTTTSVTKSITVLPNPPSSGLTPGSFGSGLGVENWTWLKGSLNYANGSGLYETQFGADASNLPSSRQYAATWYSGGKLWMFGGTGYDSIGAVGALNDLWYCTPPSTTPDTSGQLGQCSWTWVAGSNKANAFGVYPSGPQIFSAVSIPGARTAAATWTDLNGNMWLFGGAGYDHAGNSGALNDMWSFNVNGQSEWVGGSNTYNDQGSATTPAARAYATYWTDKSGNFWLFGGQGINSAGTTVYLNDLWYFTPAYSKIQQGTPVTNGTWTQVMPGATNSSGVYSSTTPSSVIPGARINGQAWVVGNAQDSQLWMFGGSGYDSTGAFGSMNDVWMFDTKTKVWTYEAGTTQISGDETIIAKGVYNGSNNPSARLGSVGWTGTDGTTLWMFGGSGSDSTATTSTNDGGGALNELWAFDTTSRQWAFMAGSDITVSASTGLPAPTNGGAIAGSAGIYQPQGTISNYNIPGSRVWPNLWVDTAGNVWLFGGTGDDVIGSSGYLNDMWLMQTTILPK